MQQHLFAGLEGRQLIQIQPGRCVHLRDACRFMQRHAFRHRQDVPRIGDDFFGHGTTGQQRANTVAELPGRSRTDFDNHP